MSRDQIVEEKLAVQKALLHFEAIHGRPVSDVTQPLHFLLLPHPLIPTFMWGQCTMTWPPSSTVEHFLPDSPF